MTKALPRWIVLAVILIAATALRVYQIDRQSLWIDELLSLEISSGHGFAERQLPHSKLLDPAPDLTSLANAAPTWRIIPEQVCESHPPLFFLLLRVWRDFWPSDTGIRMLSAIISVIGIAIIYDVGCLLSGPTTGLWAAAILAVAGSQIVLAQEARQYTMLLTLVLLCGDLLLRIEKFGFTKRRGILLGISLFAMMWTHYFGIAPAVALLLYGIVRLQPSDRRRVITVFVATAVVYLIIWGPVVLRQTHNLSQNNGWLHENSEGHIGNTFTRLAMLPIRLLGEPFTSANQALTATGAVFACALLIYGIALRKHRHLLLPLLLFIFPIAMILGFDLIRSTWHLYVLRYSIVAAGGLALLLASPIIDQRWLRHAIPAAVVLYAILAFPATYTPWKEDYRDIVAYIEKTSKSDPIVIFSPTGDDFEGGIYLGIRHYSTATHPMAVLTGTASNELLAQLRKYPSVWLVGGWQIRPGEEVLPGAHLLGTHRTERIGIVFHMTFNPPTTRGS